MSSKSVSGISYLRLYSKLFRPINVKNGYNQTFTNPEKFKLEAYACLALQHEELKGYFRNFGMGSWIRHEILFFLKSIFIFLLMYYNNRLNTIFIMACIKLFINNVFLFIIIVFSRSEHFFHFTFNYNNFMTITFLCR